MAAPSLFSRVLGWFGLGGAAARADSRPRLRSRYDAAVHSPESSRHWAEADANSPTAANQPGIRYTLRNRSRYEYDNNSYCSGMVRTRADDLVGTGPTLQILTDDDAVAAQVEKAFAGWAQAMGLAEKLHTMDQARARDGEAFAVLRTNRGLADPVKLDLHLVEADRVTPSSGVLYPILPQPGSMNDTGQYFDGISYDSDGNPVSYSVLRQHPGDLLRVYPPPVDVVPAQYMLHWFRRDRPGQLRGVPELTSSLPLFAYLRRWTLASLSAAEVAATMGAAVLESDAPANEEDSVTPSPFATVEIERGQMTELPGGFKLSQLTAQQPATTYGEFKREVLQECGRPLRMPIGVVTADSSKHNFSSAKLDHFGYRSGLKVDRSFAERTVLERVFLAWLEEARLVPGLLPAALDVAALPRAWYWPGWVSMDKDEAKLDTERLQNGTATLAETLAAEGIDWKDQIRQMGREKKMRAAEGVPLPPPGGGGQAPLPSGTGVAAELSPGQITEMLANRHVGTNGHGGSNGDGTGAGVAGQHDFRRRTAGVRRALLARLRPRPAPR